MLISTLVLAQNPSGNGIHHLSNSMTVRDAVAESGAGSSGRGGPRSTPHRYARDRRMGSAGAEQKDATSRQEEQKRKDTMTSDSVA